METYIILKDGKMLIQPCHFLSSITIAMHFNNRACKPVSVNLCIIEFIFFFQRDYMIAQATEFMQMMISLDVNSTAEGH